MRSRRVIPLAVASLAYVVALVQRPGELVADTKVNLFLDPVRFLGDVLSLWNPTTDLGHVWAGQYAGYAWPMAPWFAAGDALGLPAWLVHRLWLGTLLALAAWGTIRLLDALLARERGAAHAAAAVLVVINPYVTVYFARQSIALLAYASLPWLLLCVHRGLREPRGWRWPAAFALVLASAGGGVNAGLTGWVLLGPLLLMIYDRAFGGVGRGAIRPFLLRLAPVAILANLWWVLPLALSSRAAPDFLAYTEQPGTIWGTTSLSESLRLMGFWGSYVGSGFGGHLRPYQGSAPALLLLLPVVVAGLVTPALSLSALLWTRRWRYAPFFALLTLLGLVVMTAGWPEGTPMRHLVTGVYYHVDLVQFLRTTYKAGALTALGLAGLGGAAFGLAWRWLAGRGPVPRAALVAGAAALVALASWPLVTGRAVERQLSFDVPAVWHQVAADLDQRPDDTRAMVLPGQLFAFADWGGTVDPVLPALTEHDVAERWIIPFADPRSSDLQFAVDGLVTQERLRPGQLRPLLDLMGVGDVVLAADGDRGYSGEMPAGDLEDETFGLGVSKGYGPRVRAPRAASGVAPALRVPELQRIELPTGGLVRVLPRGPMTVVDGASGAVTGLAAYGALRPDRPLAYGPDLGAAGVRAAAREGASLVISDTNRRRAYVAARSRGQVGPTLTADQSVSQDGNVMDPFGGEDDPEAAGRETVAVLDGARSVSAPASPQVTQFPDQRPFAAIDGDPATAWIADRQLVPTRPTLTLDFDAPRDVATVDLMPYSDSRGAVRAVDVNGRRFAVHRGWNHLHVGLRHVGSLVVHLADVTRPRHGNAGAGGIRELRIAGLHVTEALRPPTDVEDALRGADLSRSSLTYVLERTTADVPLRQGRYVGERGAGQLRDAQDPERALRRVIAPPAARSYAVDGWATVDPRTPDHVFDDLAGGLHGHGAGAPLVRADSSARFEGLGRYRASGAFDGAGARAWLGQWIAGRPAWLSWEAARPVTVKRLTLDPPGVRVRRPTRVALSVDGGAPVAAAVDQTGEVVLPRALHGRSFRLEILAARFPVGTPARDRQRRAVGIGEIRGGGVQVTAAPRRGVVALTCGATHLQAGGHTVALGGTIDRAALDAGRPLKVRACGGKALSLPAGQSTLVGATAPLRLDGVRLSSRAPTPMVTPGEGGRVVDAGTQTGGGGREGVRVQAGGASWLVLGASYDKFWRASCDGHDLGTPRPMQGYANAWPIDAGCHAVAFVYGLQKAADGAYVISAVVCAALLALLLVGAVRRRRGGLAHPPGGGLGGDAAPDPDPAPLALGPAPRPVPLTRALTIGVGFALVIGVAFGLRAGALAGPILALILWRGISDALLGRAVALVLVVAVPAVYVGVGLAQGDHHLKANATKYPGDRLAGHWLTLAGLLLVMVLLWRTLAHARRGEPAHDRDATAAPAPAPAPGGPDADPLPSRP